MAMRYRIEKKEACLEHQITNEVRLRLEATNFFLISEAFFFVWNRCYYGKDQRTVKQVFGEMFLLFLQRSKFEFPLVLLHLAPVMKTTLNSFNEYRSLRKSKFIAWQADEEKFHASHRSVYVERWISSIST